MSLRERIYSILVVSATDSFTSAFADLLLETKYYPIHAVTSISAAKRVLAEKAFDFIIINYFYSVFFIHSKVTSLFLDALPHEVPIKLSKQIIS